MSESPPHPDGEYRYRSNPSGEYRLRSSGQSDRVGQRPPPQAPPKVEAAPSSTPAPSAPASPKRGPLLGQRIQPFEQMGQCPVCGIFGCSRVLSAVCQEGTTSGSAYGPVVAAGAQGPELGAAYLRTHSQTDLARALTPPEEPSPHSMLYHALSGLAISAAVIVGIMAWAIAGAVIDLGLTWVGLSIVQALGWFTVAIPVGIWAGRRFYRLCLRVFAHFDITSSSTYQARWERWQRGMSQWQVSQYCSRTNVVYLPFWKAVASPGQAMHLLFQHEPEGEDGIG